MLHVATGPLHGTLENLSCGGALVSFAAPPSDDALELELRLAGATGWVHGHVLRVESGQRSHVRVAVAFDRVDARTTAAIESTIEAAMSAARRRPILVIDDHAERRDRLVEQLAHRGMTPLAPRTPLDAIDLLTRSQLHVSVCCLAPGFGVPTSDLAELLSDSFPWITTTEISDDLEATAGRAMHAWSETPVARLAIV